jgi:hypothetical protein
LIFDDHDVETAMQHNNQWLAVMLIVAGLQLSACQQKADEPTPMVPTTRGEYSGPALHRVRLTAKRADELGIQTAPVREEKISGKLCKVIPAIAVVYDQQGNTWTFKNPDSLVFVRERISVDTIKGDLAVLVEGPAAGTAVVTAGAARLFNDTFNETREGMVESKITADGKREKSSGTATMLENGNLKVVHRAAGVSGLTASVVIEYKPQDEEYQKILDQVGGLKVGESKAVPPLPEQ